MEFGLVQQKILGAMFLVLVICISLMTYATSRKESIFPPTTNQCPDFFTFNGTSCVAPSSLYTNISPLDITTSTSIYNPTSTTSLCKKKKWAITNSVTWDGITNNESIVDC